MTCSHSAMPELQVSYHDVSCIIDGKGISFADDNLIVHSGPHGLGMTYVIANNLQKNNQGNHIFLRRADMVPDGIIDTVNTTVNVKGNRFTLHRQDVADFFFDATGVFVTYFEHGIGITKLNSAGGPCVKQNVYATVVTPNGEHFTGTNLCRNPQKVCPREVQGMKSGEGYELCQSVCQQDAHAEVNAIALAGKKAKGSILYLSGHLYACVGCQSVIKEANIAELRVMNSRVPFYRSKP